MSDKHNVQICFSPATEAALVTFLMLGGVYFLLSILQYFTYGGPS